MKSILCTIFIVFPLYFAKGQTLKPMIINGKEATSIDSVSLSTIAIQMPSTANGIVQYSHCTAFVVKENILMTAAHCLAYLTDKSGVQAILSLAPQFGPDDGSQKRITLTDFRINPNYHGDNTGVYNDIALIKLQSNLPSYYRVLNFDFDLDSTLIAGQSLVVAGFGSTADFGQPDPLPPLLRFASAPFVGGNNSSFQDSDQLLIDQSKSGFCNGDSGGPLYFQSNSKLTPIGIVSHVTQDASGKWTCKSIGAFTRISFFKNWILQALFELN
ncbi:MAG: S1 family peptidase [Bdellovibrio sp.]|nr:S1 family peptidase [Bdellovibrio sp.]